MTKTKKNVIKQSKTKKHIQHHHLLIRCETELHIAKKDKAKLEQMIDIIVNKIKMKKLGGMSFYVDGAKDLSGVTAVNVIETSHIAAHVWSYPEKHILHHPHSKNLLQLDIYTCGKLHNYDIIHILELLSEFKPTHIDITLLNRKYSLTINKHMTWTHNDDNLSWNDWLKQQKIINKL